MDICSIANGVSWSKDPDEKMFGMFQRKYRDKSEWIMSARGRAQEMRSEVREERSVHKGTL